MIEEYCKNCKHSKENEDIFSLRSSLLGIVIIGAPMPRSGIFGDNDDYECDNIDSIYYGDKMEEYDTCSKFEPK